MFRAEGEYSVVIKQALIAEAKFNKDPNSFDACLLCEAEDGTNDWWRGEVSSRWGTGNASDRTQAQLTIESLTRAGLPNGDMSQFHNMVGMKTTITVEQSKKDPKYFNIKYIGGSSAPVALDPNEAQRRMQALLSNSATAQMAAPASTANPPASNPPFQNPGQAPTQPMFLGQQAAQPTPTFPG